jgi:hypothetical protein
VKPRIVRVRTWGKFGGTAAWPTVNVSPPIVSVPDRSAPPFGATLNDTEPLPVPDDPDVRVMNDALLAAVH